MNMADILYSYIINSNIKTILFVDYGSFNLIVK